MGETLLDALAIALVAVGLTLSTISLYGLLRMTDVFRQLHAAALITGPAVVLILLASVASGSAEVTTSAALVIIFVLVTSPLASHVIAQAAHHRASGDPPGEQDDDVPDGVSRPGAGPRAQPPRPDGG